MSVESIIAVDPPAPAVARSSGPRKWQTGISAPVDCGGFPKAFAPADLSDCGLLADHGKATSVQKLLRAE